MDKIGYLYESPTEIRIADKLPLLCEKGLKLIVIKDCYDESYLYELTHYWRGGLRELKLKEGDFLEHHTVVKIVDIKITMIQSWYLKIRNKVEIFLENNN